MLSPGNRAKPCKFSYVKPVGNFILQCNNFTFVYESSEDIGIENRDKGIVQESAAVKLFSRI